jgi:magnesium chelatase family protein
MRGTGGNPCRCSPGELRRYQNRLSGPLLDRFDLFVEVNTWEGRFELGREIIGGQGKESPPSDFPDRDHVWEVRRQLRAQQNQRPCLAAGADEFLDEVRRSLGLSLRGVERCARVARTLAALEGREQITTEDLTQALEFRRPQLGPEKPGA